MRDTDIVAKSVRPLQAIYTNKKMRLAYSPKISEKVMKVRIL